MFLTDKERQQLEQAESLVRATGKSPLLESTKSPFIAKESAVKACGMPAWSCQVEQQKGY